MTKPKWRIGSRRARGILDFDIGYWEFFSHYDLGIGPFPRAATGIGEGVKISGSFCGVKSRRAGHTVFVGSAENVEAAGQNCRAAAASASAIPASWHPTDCRMSTFSPWLMLQKKLMMNGICASPNANAPHRIQTCRSMIEFGTGQRDPARARRRSSRRRHTCAADMPAMPCEKHRHENHVHENEREAEMHPAPEIVHQPPGHLRDTNNRFRQTARKSFPARQHNGSAR